MEFVSTGVVARALGVTVNTVKRWISKETLRGIRLPSGHYRVPRAELDRLVQGWSLAARGQDRERAWKRYEDWRRGQPPSSIKLGEVLEWNDRLLDIAAAHGPIPVASPAEKARRVRAMHESLATLHGD